MSKLTFIKAPAFTPASLPGLLIWADFSDITSLYQSTDTSSPVTANGQSIGRASDKSGHGNHFIQATAGSKPIYTTGAQNGKSGATFTGANSQLMSATSISLGGTTASVFLVIKGTTPPANSRISSFLANPDIDDFNTTTSAIFLFYPATTTAASFRNGSQLATGTITNNTFFQLGSIYDGVNSTIYINNVAGTPVANSNTFGGTGGFHLGGRPTFQDTTNAVVLEYIATNTALNSTQRAQLKKYFTSKYAV